MMSLGRKLEREEKKMVNKEKTGGESDATPFKPFYDRTVVPFSYIPPIAPTTSLAPHDLQNVTHVMPLYRDTFEDT